MSAWKLAAVVVLLVVYVYVYAIVRSGDLADRERSTRPPARPVRRHDRRRR